ncbi:polysaccharide lyase family protein [Clostridium cibarium]|uniref:rhamnogalacturonan endolyase n=1 Tax=Clostridium cibarium TaxID=2762247 RepID=A0ABR8PRE9_9CLOT|nr:polysaccharide lyase family protein [Clostridium cibarium]MBD7910756.1 rhamnogalacturonate lyase [Clostridium cibarium]
MRSVNLVVNNMEATLDNGLIRVKFNNQGSVDSLIKNGKELLKGLTGDDRDVNRKRTFYLDYHANGKFRNFQPRQIKVLQQEEDLVHIAYIDTTSLLYAEYHIIMKKGISGIYSYVITANNSDEKLEIAELRTVYRMGTSNFNISYNSERIGKQPSHSELETKEKLQDETYRYEDEEVYSKYDYAGYFKDNHLWGEYGDEFGAWFIPASTEYYPSGPMKQELLVHYDGIILNYMTGAHFGTGAFDVPRDWKKFYGPWLFYINDGTHEEMIQDAKNIAKEQGEEWPYTWVNEELYPLERGTVKGKLISKDGRDVGNAMVVLAKDGGEFLRQKGDYIFYNKADSDGNFEIEKVRPGEYTLYAYATHGTITRQLEKKDIEVLAGELNLGNLVWEAPRFTNLLWQIGKSDRKASEFKYGSEFRNYKWMTLLPKNLNYKIGESNEKEDWYYAEPKDATWNINFQLDKKLQKNAHLTIALAGATTYEIGVKLSPKLIVKVNGEIIKKLYYENDTTFYRSAVKSGRYHLEEIEVNKDLLNIGYNNISLESVDGAFMYDIILLETEEKGTEFTNKMLVDCYKASGYIDDEVSLKLKGAIEKIYNENFEDKNEILADISSMKFDFDIKNNIINNLNK